MDYQKHGTKRPIPVLRVLRKLGEDIKDARRRRRLPMSLVAERAGVSRVTLAKLEKGDPGISIGILGSVLHAMDLLERLRELADSQYDSLGRLLEEEQLPQRIHRNKRELINRK
ncbi:MAG: helix-turn-helix domain-containing protein [Candidatus Sabulitectum sp.]|nr:helix-turn-helix domain-containing protein [Candidatus Sabulitectum sp.]